MGIRSRGELRWLSWLLVLVGFGWLGWLLRREGVTLVGQFQQADWSWLAFAVLVGALAIGHDTFIFYLLFDPPVRQTLGWRFIGRLLWVGQMVKHLPGRIWGVLYQINEAQHLLAPTAMLRVNLDFTLVGLIHSLVLPATIFLFLYAQHAWAMLVLLLGLSGLGLALRWQWLDHLVGILPTRLAHYAVGLTRRPTYAWSDIAGILLLVVSHWAFYLLAWQLFPRILPQLAGVEMARLCLAYSLAWVVGLVSMVTPAGLGVREAAFVFLSTTVTTPANLALLAVFVRVWLLLIDLILFVGFVGVTLPPSQSKS